MTENVDIVIIGAGFSGLYAVHKFHEKYNVVCFEAGDGVGGTWYWNRYPGARVDIESVEYSYGFDEELQQEWKWPEYFSAQPDLERYANHVAGLFVACAVGHSTINQFQNCIALCESSH